jgi:DNA-binding transcriptional LysR family regulator
LFRDVAHTRSLSKAAKLNDLSQPAATQRMHELERRIGVDLLDRSTRPLGLTPAGKLYEKMCRDVLRLEDDFLAQVAEVRQSAEGTVRVASIYSIGLSDKEWLETEFLKLHPDGHLQIETLRPNKVYEAVLEDRADLGFISYPEHKRELAIIPWREERMTVAVYPAHPFASLAVVRAADLGGEPFVAFDEEVIIRREIDKFLRENGVDVRIVMSLDNIQSIKEAVAKGAGVSILPERTMREEIDDRRLVSVPLDAELRRPVAVIHRKKKKLNRAGRDLLDLVKNLAT